MLENKNKPILIASASFDEHAYGPVAKALGEREYPVIVYRTDQLLTCGESFDLSVSDDGNLSIAYNNQPIMPEDLTSAWFRKIGNFAIPNADTELAKQLYLNNEVRALHDTIWSLYPEDLWLSSPANMAAADRKLSQLLVARELGFVIPETLVSSDWEFIEQRLLQEENNKMIVKMMRGVINDGNNIKSLYSTIIDQDRLSTIRKYTTPFPGIYQPFVPKAREWRVTVVGDRVFPVAVYTNDSSKDDWRKHQLSGGVEFKSEPLPEQVEGMCIEYLGRMSLGFGAFDFIEQPDGELVFLECNPNGQYGWLEEALDLKITESIADELISVGNGRRVN